MDIAIALLLTLAVGAFVVWPLVSRSPPEVAGEVALTPLERQKREAYRALKEAEFDFQMGKLTQADYDMLRARYTEQALSAIAAIESAHGGARAAEGRRPTRIAYCPTCGRGVPPRAKFCAGCGQAVAPRAEAVA